MKVLQTDKETFKIFGNSLDIKDKLPTKIYDVNFNPMGGFFLTTHKDFECNEKLYGGVEDRINNIVKSYKSYNRALGVIFSGDKGIGKSLASRLLCQKMMTLGYPVIIVNNTDNGIIEFLGSIEQECVFFFDEFEKTYRIGKTSASDNSYVTQNDFLTFFDGTNNIKHVFIITCNKLDELSPYMINRPGRFHYHIRWTYPSKDDITEYLHDKLDKSYWGEIEKICRFSQRKPLNYDCLQSISFELNLGISFEDAIKVLNIVNFDNMADIKLTVELDNGSLCVGYDRINMTTDDREETYVRGLKNNDRGGDSGYVHYFPSKLIYEEDKILLDLESTTHSLSGNIVKAVITPLHNIYSFTF